jgi:5-(carboxyamino)imidazole ribonucleotide synthase
VTEVHEACVERAQAQRAIASAQAIAKGLDYVGVLCVEFFGLQDGSLVVNEMAPRPHNSGHWSIEGADVSQFELQVRTLAGLRLVQPRQHSPAIMLNLLGDLWFRGGAQETTPDWAGVLALPGSHLHLYGKLSPRPGRKMGHLTLTGAGIEEVRATALQAAQRLGIAPF